MNKIKILLLSIFVIVIGTTTVYAYNEDNLKISTKQSENLDIKYENINMLSENTANIKFINDKTGVEFTTELEKPGDYIEFSVNVVNYSNLDAKISEIAKSSLTEQEQKYLKYEVKYIDNSDIKEGQILKSKETKTIKIRLEYKYDITADDLPTSDNILNSNFSIVFVEK